jgi:hypothetical protein
MVKVALDPLVNVQWSMRRYCLNVPALGVVLHRYSLLAIHHLTDTVVAVPVLHCWLLR